MSGLVRILACGSIDRGDDAAALLAVRRLPAAARRRAVVEEIGQLGAEHLLSEPGCRTVVVDCIHGVPGGRIVEVPLAELPGLDAAPGAASTHSLSPGRAVALASQLGAVGPLDRFLGIGGESFVAGAAPSPAVTRHLPDLVARLVALTVDGIPGGPACA